MTFNINKIKTFYSDLNTKIDNVRSIIDRPLTLTEKVLFSHSKRISNFSRGDDYVDFSPDRVAMQDAWLVKIVSPFLQQFMQII